MNRRMAALVCLMGCGLLAGCHPAVATTQPGGPKVVTTVRPLPGAPPDMAHRIGMAQQTLRVGATDGEVRALLGPPTLVQNDQWLYVSDSPEGHAYATIGFAQGRVTSVRSDWSPGWERLASARSLVAVGDQEAQVLVELGQPAQRHAGVWWLYAPADFAPAHVELFFADDTLSWGGAYLLARIGRLKPGAAADLTTDDVQGCMGPPLATETGAQWDYSGTTGGTEVHTTVYFKAGRVVQVVTAAVPHAP
jgi:outer membrane protein assembly factor BamE (lipoprotein component of BamABCDE complex)